MIRSLLFLLLTLYLVRSKTQENNSNKLHLLVLAPFPSQFHPLPTFSGGHSLVPAVQLAVEHINNSSHVLPNHTLEVIIDDSGCNITAETAIPFVKHVLSGKEQVLGIVGPACTEASLLLANMTQSQDRSRYGIVQAMMATSDVFDSHQRYQHTFGMVSSFSVLVTRLINIAKERQWTNIAVLYDQSREFFGRTFDSFVRQANVAGINFTSWPVLAPDYLERPLNELKSNQDSRIILAIMSANTSRHVACLAGIKGLTFPQYQFVYADRSLGNFLANSNFDFTDSKKYVCNESIILKGLNGSLLLRYGLDSIPSDTFLNQTAKLTVGEVKDQYFKNLKEYGDQRGENLTFTSYAYPYYDATWALALSIHQALEEIGSFSQNNLRFLNNSPEAELLRQKFENLSFQGVSVNVEFNNKTRRVQNEVDMYQVNGTETITQNITFLEDSFKVVYIHLNAILIVIGLVLTVATLLLTVLLHFVNIHFREYVTIKGSSPRLNNFIFLSCYLVLLCVFLQTIHYGFITDFNQKHLEIAAKVICNLRSFLFPICLSLIINTVFVKLWRLYSIFNRSFKRQVLVSDKHLVLVVLGMQVCVILLSIPWIAIAHVTLYHKETFNEVEQIQYVETLCFTDSWLATLPYMFVFVFVTLSFWLAYRNRKIRQNQYRSKETIIFTYLFCLMLGVLGIVFTVSFLLRPTINLLYALDSFSYLGMVLLCNSVLFVPPFYSILVRKFQDPTKKKTIVRGLQIIVHS